MPDTQVLIGGAGPVGLSTAIALRRQGVDCRVVERHPSTLEYPKGRGVSTRTMEIFRAWGIEDAVTAAGLPREENEFFYLGETLLSPDFKRFGSAELGRSASPSPTERLICAQDLVETILLERATELGTDVRFGTELVELTDTDDGVQAVIEDRQTGARHLVAAEHVVAADGSRSTVRELLGIGTSGPGVVGHSVSILVEAALADRVADRLAIIYKVDRPHPSAFFAVVDNNSRWLLMMARDPETDPPESFTDERCIDLVRTGLGDDDVPFRLLGRRFFEPTALVADRFQSGRVFLAGDAAHLTTPFGALGMNCGIADAHNLAWKLSAVLHGWASPTLLDTYEAERHPVAQATSDASVLRQDVSKGPPRAAFDGITLGYAYTSAAVIPDATTAPAPEDPIHDYLPTARPGHRAPHVWLQQDGTRRSTLDLFDGTLTILAGSDVDRHALDAAVSATAGARIPLRAYAIGPNGDLDDPAGRWAGDYGVEADGLVLVRPDGFVAWRAPTAPTADSIVSAARVVAGKA